MIQGYFDLRKIALKIMPCLWTSGSKEILIGSLNEALIVIFVQGAAELLVPKVLVRQGIEPGSLGEQRFTI